ncbi:MAG TPA: hypothetical protein VMR70_21165, partial [Flavisolibacter sp.]|nr:hypothetical protein [Flavisolibacter sp.]
MKKYLIGLALLTALVSCEKEKRDCPSSTQKQFSETGFTRITAGETFRFTIKQGATYSLVAKGCSQDLNDLRIAVLPNRTLDIH